MVVSVTCFIFEPQIIKKSVFNMFFIIVYNLPRNGSLDFFGDAEAADMFNRYDAVDSRSKLFNVSKCTYETPLSQLPLKIKWCEQLFLNSLKSQY